MHVSFHFGSFQVTDLASGVNAESSRGNESSGGVPNTAHESREGLRSLSVTAKQEVVQKARKFLKRLTPDETYHGSETSKVHVPKGIGSKGGSTCIHSPLEVKSLVIKSRETR